MKRRILLLLLFLACSQSLPPERYGFVTVLGRDSAGVRDTAFATGEAITVPHVSMMYSVIELEIAAALHRSGAPGDSVLFRQFYPDRDVGPSFTMHRGFVVPRGDGKVELRHGWLS